MERNKCEGMINELIKFNFDSFIFKLTKNRKIKVIINENSIGFTGGYVWFGRDGIQTTIDYRIIEDISPSEFDMEEEQWKDIGLNQEVAKIILEQIEISVKEWIEINRDKIKKLLQNQDWYIKRCNLKFDLLLNIFS